MEEGVRRTFSDKREVHVEEMLHPEKPTSANHARGVKGKVYSSVRMFRQAPAHKRRAERVRAARTARRLTIGRRFETCFISAGTHGIQKSACLCNG